MNKTIKLKTNNQFLVTTKKNGKIITLQGIYYGEYRNEHYFCLKKDGVDIHFRDDDNYLIPDDEYKYKLLPINKHILFPKSLIPLS